MYGGHAGCIACGGCGGCGSGPWHGGMGMGGRFGQARSLLGRLEEQHAAEFTHRSHTPKTKAKHKAQADLHPH